MVGGGCGFEPPPPQEIVPRQARARRKVALIIHHFLRRLTEHISRKPGRQSAKATVPLGRNGRSGVELLAVVAAVVVIIRATLLPD